jgi:hypothetical protein
LQWRENDFHWVSFRLSTYSIGRIFFGRERTM